MTKFIARLTLAVAFVFIAGCEPKPDGPYRIVPEPLEVSQPTVFEFFGYFCPHCYQLEPMVKAWRRKLPSSVAFVRVPVSFGRPQGRVLMRAYYLGELLGVLDKSHPMVFQRIHVERRPIATDEDLISFFVALGIPRAKVESTLASEALKQKLEDAEQLARRFRIDSVPTFVVNGRYRTDAGMTGSARKLFTEIDRLLRKRQSDQ